MGVYCCVPSCRNSNIGNRISLFRFPSVTQRPNSNNYDRILQQKRLQAWFFAVKGNFSQENSKIKRICSSHFISGRPAHFRDINNPDWVPSINLGYSKAQSSPTLRLERYIRLKNRSKLKTYPPTDKKKTNSICVENHVETSFVQIEMQSETGIGSNVMVQSDINDSNISSLEEIQPNVEIETGVGVQTNINAAYISSLEEELRARNDYIKGLEKELLKCSDTVKEQKEELQKCNDYIKKLENLITFRKISTSMTILT